MAGWTNFEVVYEAILRHIKDKGIPIYHRTIKSGAGGYYNPIKCSITIDKEARGTIEGCYYILHELQHFNDHRNGKFKVFFEKNLPYSEENFQLVIEAEMSAIIEAKKELKKWGIKFDPPELTESGLKESIKFWKEYYFK